MHKTILLAAALALPLMAEAASDDWSAPEKPKCERGLVYDETAKACIDANSHSIDTQTLYREVRALAHDGRHGDAQLLLALMPQDDDRTLTYLGFTHRKMGHTQAARDYYTRALARNPGNILARSYMGQGFVEEGEIAQALGQLRAIRTHGGTGTWAETALRTAIATGRTFDW